MLQQEKETEIEVAELKRQYEREFGEVYGSWYEKNDDEHGKRYYTFWDFAMSSRDVWEVPDDPEKEYERARKLWAEEWRTGKMKAKYISRDGSLQHEKDDSSFEEFWNCWEWKKNRAKYAKACEAEAPRPSEFWDDCVGTKQQSEEVEEMALEPGVQEVQEKMGAMGTSTSCISCTK